MKLPAVVLACLLLAGCTEGSVQSQPFGPSASWPSGSPAFSGMVLDGSGVCIPGAIVEVVSGPAAGLTVTQETPCDAWSYFGGFHIEGLTPGVTLLARAPGYTSSTKILGPGWNLVFVLAPDVLR